MLQQMFMASQAKAADLNFLTYSNVERLGRPRLKSIHRQIRKSELVEGHLDFVSK